ncbi:hypothetical protein AK830_g5399 [Neonectria ditissima]|uniref:Uncharacterized protein n=1 Tax=Neonectria ditissima TaxID=78410 RepID=A0A0P7BLA9_9HYPO|nr:hypothetical protein AK830_g5399 [Neonectria ditissima]
MSRRAALLRPEFQHPGGVLRLQGRHHCGACGFDFEDDDRCVPIIWDKSFSHFEAFEAFDFANGDISDSLSVEYSSRIDICVLKPGVRRDSVTIHADCFKLFMKLSQEENKLAALCLLAQWTQPWVSVSSLHLDPVTDVPRGIAMASERYGIPGLASLPLEVAELIRDYSPTNILWRFASLLTRMDRLHHHGFGCIDSVPVCKISSWERGVRPTLLPKPLRRGVYRLTLDSQGLKMIERLPKRPCYQSGASVGLAYVVEYKSCFKKMTVSFKKFGLARLNFESESTRLKVWDRPCPPNPADCYSFHKPWLASYYRMIVTETHKSSGILLFFYGGYLASMHTYKGGEQGYGLDPDLAEKWKGAMWLYLPLPPGDRIEAVGAQKILGHPEGFSYVFRTRLAGDVAFGRPCAEPELGSVVLGVSPNPTLISYAEKWGCNLLAARDFSVRRRPNIWFRPHKAITEVSSRSIHVLFSAAPLQDVTRMQIFEDKDGGFCRGILFDYADGAQRTVGQCKFGVDTINLVTNPSHFCIRSFDSLSQGYYRRGAERTKVVASSSSSHSHGARSIDWKCFTFSGVMEFLFTNDESSIKIVLQANHQ